MVVMVVVVMAVVVDWLFLFVSTGLLALSTSLSFSLYPMPGTWQGTLAANVVHWLTQELTPHLARCAGTSFISEIEC